MLDDDKVWNVGLIVILIANFLVWAGIIALGFYAVKSFS